MKKLLLLSCSLFLFSLSHAQVFYCVSPAATQGNYAFSYATPGAGWGVADLTVPANAIQDTLMLADDGTSGDSLACNPLINDLTGKIAILYRGSCEFGVKARNCQDAGAIGVVIVNNAPGTITMGPGAQGANVTIPTVMISNGDGALLRAQMKNGSVVVFIGSKNGLYANDLGLNAKDVMMSYSTAKPKFIATNASEFNVRLGSWVHNYGHAAQNMVLSSYITGAATYSASSSATPINLNPGDSAYVALPTYAASSYSGLYKVRYVASNALTDSFPGDNVFKADFLVDSIFSYAWIDSLTKLPVSTSHQSNNPTPIPVEYRVCSHFMDAHASRMALLGLYFSAYTCNGCDLTGEDILTQVYEWNDVFTGISTIPSPPWTLNKVGEEQYEYQDNSKKGQMIYVPFSAPINLKDNQRYLFCAYHNTSTLNQNIPLGFDSHYNYKNVIDSTDQPVSVVFSDTSSWSEGFGTDVTSSVSAKFGLALGVREINNSISVTPYPNPTVDFVEVVMKGMNGSAELNIMDLEGKVISTQRVKVSETVTVNVKNIPDGNYVFNMRFDNGKAATFKVVIAR